MQSTQPLMSSFGAFPDEQAMHPVAPSPSAFVTSGAWHGSHDGAPLPANLPTGHNAHSVCFKGTSLARLARYAKKQLAAFGPTTSSHCWHCTPNWEYVVPVQSTQAVRSAFGSLPGPHAVHVRWSSLTTFGSAQSWPWPVMLYCVPVHGTHSVFAAGRSAQDTQDDRSLLG